jgi:integrase
MLVSMSLKQNEHGVWCVRKKVPERLASATAQILGNGKPRQSWLQRSLKTKDRREAKRLAPPVLMEFDRVLAEAEALLVEAPVRTTLDRREIDRIAAFFYANELAADDEYRREGGSEALFQDIARQLSDAGIEVRTPYSIGSPPPFGLSDREMQKKNESIETVLPAAQQALARGDISMMRWEVDELLKLFRINLDPKSEAYRELGMEVLRSFVKALQAVERRQKDEVVDTPHQLEPIATVAASGGGTLSAAFAGWKKEAERPETTVAETERAVRLFTELHGDMLIAAIKRSHVHSFRAALQNVPRLRAGKLANLKLPELAEWGREHPAIKVTATTVNKQLGAVQAVALWARDKGGMVPDDVPWADPFSRMRLRTEEPTRESFTPEELKAVFGGPVFAEGTRPAGGKGEAAFWLPLLALFTGARRSELAGLTVENVDTESFGAPVITITKDRSRGKRLKTQGSQRAVPLHKELLRLGFLEFVSSVRKNQGANSWLFSEIAPDKPGALKGRTKWFSRYIRDREVESPDKVFHSFRHGFKDALRAGGVGEDVIDALTGHSTKGSVSRGYGAKDMVRRFGIERLVEAISAAKFNGLDLAHIQPVLKRLK